MLATRVSQYVTLDCATGQNGLELSLTGTKLWNISAPYPQNMLAGVLMIIQSTLRMFQEVNWVESDVSLGANRSGNDDRQTRRSDAFNCRN